MNFIKTKEHIYLNDNHNEMIAEVRFPLVGDHLVEINRTYVDSSLRGQGVANKLLEAAYQQLKEQNYKVIPTCSYALAWFKRSIDKQDILKPGLDLDKLKEECAI